MEKKTKHIFIFTTLTLILVSLFSILHIQKIHADTSDNMTGFAWAGDTIGYIFMNCTSQPNSDVSDQDQGDINFNFDRLIKKAYASPTDYCDSSPYGVTIDNPVNGYLSGYAWSPNIGWVQFGGFPTNGFPSNGAGTTQDNARLIPAGSNLYKLTGWAKALAGDQLDDGWDGWISLDGTNYQVLVRANDGKVDPNGDDSKYAWAGGQDGPVIGWIDFSGVTFPPMPANGPVITISANPTSVVYSATTPTVTILWAGEGGTFTTCKADTTSGVNTTTGQKSNWPLSGSYTNMSFSSGDAGASGVTVPGTAGTTVTYDIQCFDTVSGTWVTSIDPAQVVITGPTDSFTVAPTCITEDDVTAGNNSVALTWNSAGTTSCSISNYGAASAPGPGSGSKSVTLTTTFSLTCDAIPPVSHTVSVAPICSTAGTPVIPSVKER